MDVSIRRGDRNLLIALKVEGFKVMDFLSTGSFNTMLNVVI